MKSVRWTTAARADLQQIVRFIAADNPNAAQRVRKRIHESATALGATPWGRSGHAPQTYEKLVARLPYIIAFDIHGDIVRILRIIHMARDWSEGGWPED